jgi:hypothetical protein
MTDQPNGREPMLSGAMPRPDLSVEGIRAELRRLWGVIKDSYAVIETIERLCPHERTVRHPRVIAESGAWDECLACGIAVPWWVTREREREGGTAR